MNSLDWLILISSLVFIVIYGVYKGRGSKNLDNYLMADNNIRWYMVALSVMATQASAITFLSTPGQAYADGMRFVQFYLGLPLAMIVISVTIIPIYRRLKVYTAYEYLESRFDLKTRGLAAGLFLLQRSLAAGLTIYAPAIILSTLLGWNIYWTNLMLGVLVIIYTASGGSKAVSYTQTQQMVIILLAMVGAFFMIIFLLPREVSFIDALFVAGEMGKLNAIDFSFDLTNRYTIWSGLLGGLFLQLSYFGTDQSQVQRYLTGKSVAHSRLGLLANGMIKVPMQFFILLLGALVFVYYQFSAPPLFFNSVVAQEIRSSHLGAKYRVLEQDYDAASIEKTELMKKMVQARQKSDVAALSTIKVRVHEVEKRVVAIKARGVELIKQYTGGKETGDTNYIFLFFILRVMPMGLLGLIIAAIIAASMSSTSSELNALASASVIDIYKRMIKKEASDRHYLLISKLLTVGWGGFAILFAMFANRLGTLIEAVNILGSLFYGTILGIFLVAFYLKSVRGAAAFYGAILAEIGVLLVANLTEITYLWYNVVGCISVMFFSFLINLLLQRRNPQ